MRSYFQRAHLSARHLRPEEELTELARVVGNTAGAIHPQRNEGDRLLEAVEEALRIGAAANTPVHIFPPEDGGGANWGKMELALARIKAARAAGQEVGADVYPYVNNGWNPRAHPSAPLGTRPAELLKRLDDPAMRAEIRREMETGTGWENWFAHVGHDWDRVLSPRSKPPTTPVTMARARRNRTCRQAGSLGCLFAIARAGAFAMRKACRKQQDEGHPPGIRLVRYRCGTDAVATGRAAGRHGQTTHGPAGKSSACVWSVPAGVVALRSRSGCADARRRRPPHERRGGERDHGLRPRAIKRRIGRRCCGLRSGNDLRSRDLGDRTFSERHRL